MGWREDEEPPMKTRRKKSWSEMTPSQRVWVVVGAIVQMALLGTALYDLNRRPAAEIRGSKRLWGSAVFVNFFGPIAYFLFGRKRPVPGA
jgi:hypothetical protein